MQKDDSALLCECHSHVPGHEAAVYRGAQVDPSALPGPTLRPDSDHCRLKWSTHANINKFLDGFKDTLLKYGFAIDQPDEETGGRLPIFADLAALSSLPTAR
jgi:hypothetical protein